MRKEPRATGFKDKNGRPIYEGDLLKTFHFECANRRLPRQYLYHLVVWDEPRCRAVPVQSFSLGNSGGCFYVSTDCPGLEIISGPSLFDEKRNLIMWCERR